MEKSITLAFQLPGNTMADIERHVIVSTFEMTKSTQLTADALGVSIRKVQYSLIKYGVRQPHSRKAGSKLANV